MIGAMKLKGQREILIHCGDGALALVRDDSDIGLIDGRMKTYNEFAERHPRILVLIAKHKTKRNRKHVAVSSCTIKGEECILAECGVCRVRLENTLKFWYTGF